MAQVTTGVDKGTDKAGTDTAGIDKAGTHKGYMTGTVTMRAQNGR